MSTDTQTAGTSSPIPGLRGMEHVGLTVPDMDAALEFFVHVLGARVLYETGPFKASDNWMQEHLNVDPDAIIPRLVMIALAQGPSLELFEYEAPDKRESPPRNSDAGGHHLAFYVDDMDTAVAALLAQNLKVLGEPTRMTDGPSQGLSWIYFEAPWGLQLELVSYPRGVAAYEASDQPVWRPGL